MPRDQHAFAEAELFDHRAGHEGIGPLAGEIGCRIAEEAVTVGVHFEHARAGDERQRLAVFAGLRYRGDPAIALVAAVGAASPAATAAAAASAAAATAASAVVTGLAVIAVTPPPPPPPPPPPRFFLAM